MTRTVNSAGRHSKKGLSNSRASRKVHDSQKGEKSNRMSAGANSITTKVISKRAASAKGKQKPADVTKKPSSRKRKRKVREDSEVDEDDDKEEQDDADEKEVEVAKATQRSKKTKTNTIPEVSQSKPVKLSIESSPELVTSDGMSSKDAARLRANMEIMEGSDKIEYEALFRKILAAKELIGKLSNAQAERNRKLEELAKGARAKANARKPAWVKKTTT